MFKKFFTLILALVMVAATLTVTVTAEETKTTTQTTEAKAKATTEVKTTENTEEIQTFEIPMPTVEDILKGYVSPTQESIVEIAKKEPTTPSGYCAQWTMNVYRKAGYRIQGNACDLWAEYCDKPIEEIEIGMLIAVKHASSHGFGYTYGHIGIYMGDGLVIHSSGGEVKIQTIDEWVSFYDWAGTVRCGFPTEAAKDIESEAGVFVALRLLDWQRLYKLISANAEAIEATTEVVPVEEAVK